KGQAFIFTGDSSGNAYLIEGKTGNVLFREHMVNNFESSPVVVGNHFVVGSRGSEIYRFSLE
ncbi:MAG: dehydrogenase, partial [Bacteroidaceae bacterium]|nr:dehydrogenase [Bacteroidaceae bacterium]